VREDPLLIGALGGSGTRVFSRIARHAGLFMGSEVDGHEDAKPFSDLYRRHARSFLEHGQTFPPPERVRADALLDERLARHLADLPSPDHPWGVKNPRSMLLLPYWHERFPRLRFLHVVRHGLDMAYSGNDNQLRKYGDLVIGDGVDRTATRRHDETPRRALLYWAHANAAAADFGERRLGEHYCRVRLEDLCDEPEATVRRLFEFLGAARSQALADAVAEVGRPRTLGRWRAEPAQASAELARVAPEALARFGYDRDLDTLSAR